MNELAFLISPKLLGHCHVSSLLRCSSPLFGPSLVRLLRFNKR